MSRTSIFEKRWLDLVFDGKNKSYGAYQLRLENPRTTLLAMLYGLLLIGGISGTGFLFSSFKPAPAGNLSPTINDTLILVHVDPIPKPEPPRVEPRGPETPPTTAETPASWANPEIVTEGQETPDPQPVGGLITEAPGSAEPGVLPGTTSGSGTGTTPEENPGPVVSATLDRQPSFPGGINEFYKKILKGFSNLEMEDDSAIRIIVTFVIEKDGRMTDIKVLNKPGEKYEREAVRVLRSIKEKWEPGIRKQQEMRTLFTLPITIKA